MNVICKILGLNKKLLKEIKHFQKNRITAGELKEFLLEFKELLEEVIIAISNAKKGVSVCD